ncbi:MAG: DUF1989 domain-containing protein [Paracoccaceae bacterium]|nr:DUF1989 domain-containing protein [Paracoccaceae bacterium]
MSTPSDAKKRKEIRPVICYPNNTLPDPDLSGLKTHRKGSSLIKRIIIPPRQGICLPVKAGQFFRIISSEGPQVGDLNLWAEDNLNENFYSGKTRALHGSHVSTGDRLWSNFPHLRPMATITADTLDWYGIDKYGGSVHDVIGTRCDPYTNMLLSGNNYDHCCHSNLTRALAKYKNLEISEAEQYVHDVLNVFMCTGFTRDTGQYFMKASPVRPGDYLEFFAEINLIVGLSACPGGDCSSEHSSSEAICHPLELEIYKNSSENNLERAEPIANSYSGAHGMDD